MRGVIRIFILCAVVFLAALAAEHVLVPNIMPVSWNQEPQPTFSLEVAFMLRTIRNVAALIAAIVVIVGSVSWIGARWRGNSPRA